MIDQKTENEFDQAQELRQTIELFYFAYREFTSGPDKVLEKRGLNRAHHRILYFVGRKPGIGIGELLDTLRVSKQALNAPLRQLLEMDLIRREPAPHDRRAKCLSLSPTGRRLEAQLTGIQMKLLDRAFERSGGLTKGDWHTVMRSIISPQA